MKMITRLSHAHQSYACPICPAIAGKFDERTLIRAGDVIYQNVSIFVFVGSFSVHGLMNQPIICPTKHFEHIYQIPDDVLSEIAVMSKRIAIALKHAFDCDGVMIRQNNEPAAGQHALHYHLHVFPRFLDDDLDAHMDDSRRTNADMRAKIAGEIRTYL